MKKYLAAVISDIIGVHNSMFAQWLDAINVLNNGIVEIPPTSLANLRQNLGLLNERNVTDNEIIKRLEKGQKRLIIALQSTKPL